MNRTYRLVWNRALRVVQVASELASSAVTSAAVGTSPHPRPSRFALALLACGLLSLAAPSAAQVCQQCGAAGGTTTSDRAANGGQGNGQGGSAMNIAGTHVDIAGGSSSAGNGGAGATGIDADGSAGPSGGAGGGTGTNVNGAIVGGRGGDGTASLRVPSGGGGGGAAYDGMGDLATGTGSVFIGGAGGTGGTPDSGTGGAGGGGGGAAMIMAGGGSQQLTLGASSSLTGGQGGQGGQSTSAAPTWGGGGGGGGDGVLVLGVNANILVGDRTSLIRGGMGGAGGVSQGVVGNGLDGASGAGIRALGTNLTVTNAGTIQGGDATGGGAAGAGIVTQSNAVITNGGILSGGIGATDYAPSVVFNGQNSVLMLASGSVVQGVLELASGATATVVSSAASALYGATLDGGDATLTLTRTQALDMGGAITGSGNVVSSGSGAFNLRGINLTGQVNVLGPGQLNVFNGTMQTTGSQHYGGPVRVNQDTTFASSASSIGFDTTIDSQGGAHALTVNAPTGAVTFGGALGATGALSTVTVNANTLAIGAVNAGTLSLSATGDIAQNGDFTVANGSAYATAGSLYLIGAGNTFGGPLQIQANNVDIASRTNLAIGSLSLGASGDLVLASQGTITLPSSVSTQGDIQLTGAMAPGALAARNLTLQATGSLPLAGSLTASGTVSLSSTAAIQQTGGAIVAPQLTVSTPGNVTLTQAGNAIGTVGNVAASTFSLTDSVPVTFNGNVQVGTFDLAASQGATITGSVTANTVANVAAGTVLNVGNGGTLGALAADVIDQGTLAFNRSDTARFTEALGGSGLLVQRGTGKLLFDGDGSAFQGRTQVLGGELVVGSVAGSAATLAGPVDVAAGASLGGHGRIVGNVTMATGSVLSPGNSIGTLSVDGDVSLAQGTSITAELGASGVGDTVAVNGNLALGGVMVNVVDAGGMGPGVYNLFSYTGTLALTHGGIALGSTPVGQSLQLVTLTGDRRINLVDTTNTTLNYWNANGAANATQMGGGSGTWSVTSPVWTDAQGSLTAAMTPQPGFAVFGGASGQVTVDGSAGAVTVSGMQFLSDGYQVSGDPLALVSGGLAPTVRVGDGSASSAGYVATLGSVLTGNQGLTKTDAGTLVLGGDNLYTGGTTIQGGTLAVADDRNLGDASGHVVLQGGTLRITGTAYDATSRALELFSSGGIDIADANNTFRWNGPITGVGQLTKRGAGTLEIDTAQSISGNTFVDGGTLRIGAAAAMGNGALGVRDGATFEAGADGIALSNPLLLAGNATLAVNGTDTLTLEGNVTDDATTGVLVSGTLRKTGTGTLALTAGGTYSGGTDVEAGTLRVTDGGALGAGAVALHDGTTLALAVPQQSRPLLNPLTLAGQVTVDVDGRVVAAGTIADGATTGNLTKAGSGNLVLLGNAAYGGLTTIAAGTLTVGDGGVQGTLPASIVNHGALVLDRSDDVTYAGTMSGEGGFNKLGNGMLHLTGKSAAVTGTSVIEAGILQLDGTLGGSLAMASGTQLTGSGAAGSASVASGATVSPGGSGSIARLAFHGDLQMAAGSLYAVDVNDAGQSDRLVVDGVARLGGGSVVSLGTGTRWTAMNTYTILSAAGGVNGTFAGVSSNLAFLTPTLAYTATTVNLVLSRNPVAFPAVGVTRNQRAVGGGIEAAGAGAPIYDAVVALDAAGARHAFDNLSGEIHANLRGALADDDRYQRDAINQHLVASYAQGADAAAGAWAATWGHWGDHDGDGNASRLRANGGGVIVGADTGVGSDARIGVALGTGHVSASAGGDDAQGVTRTAALYGGGRLGDVLWQAGALYSRRDIDTHRTVDVTGLAGRLEASQRARSAQAFVEAAYDIRLAHGSIDPFVNLARQQLRTDAARERGGPAALDVAGETTAQTFGTAGLRGRWDLSADGVVGVFGSLGWQHAWGDTGMLSRQRFDAGGDAFVVAGTPIAANAGVANVGLRFTPWTAVTVDAAYTGQFARHARDQSARLSLNWMF
ncbi:autotransporter outer membrane beta-barrel domain-containing protein [Luteibacter sp. PPL552]